MVGLFESGKGERAGDEGARCGIGGGGRLVRVQFATVVFRRAEMVSAQGDEWSECGEEEGREKAVHTGWVVAALSV